MARQVLSPRSVSMRSINRVLCSTVIAFVLAGCHDSSGPQALPSLGDIGRELGVRRELGAPASWQPSRDLGNIRELSEVG